jgi:hypothetical protein
MLSRQEIKAIWRSGITTHHDFWTMSLSLGEPFFEGGCLTYFDGRQVTLCAFPLRNTLPITGSAIRGLARSWARVAGVEAICLVGPRRLSLRCLEQHGFHRTKEQPRRAIGCELLIECTGNPGTIMTRRTYHRSICAAFESKQRRGGPIRAEHLELIELFYGVRELSGYLAELAFALPALLRSSRVHIIEARRDCRLLGFLAWHMPFFDVAMALFLAHDHRTPGVSDFLYGQLLTNARAIGARSVNVGPSPTRGHFVFKTKWGGRSVVPPYYFTEWAKGKLARRVHTGWGPRIVRL